MVRLYVDNVTHLNNDVYNAMVLKINKSCCTKSDDQPQAKYGYKKNKEVGIQLYVSKP